MGKRARLEGPSDDARKSSKKPRYEGNTSQAPVEEILTARQLQNLIVFEQDQALLLQSINAFRSFLSSILHPSPTDAEDVPRRRAILREYLESQRPRDNKRGSGYSNNYNNYNDEPNDEGAQYLPNLMQAWTFAASSNSDTLLSAVSSAIDQLLKILSSEIDAREHGLLLCRALLQQSQLRIISRGVSSPRHKEHILGPCLRILREIVTFDGGTLARQVYAKRDLAFDPQAIARCLTYRRLDASEPEDVIKKPTVRTTAVRYVLSHFRVQDDGAKADMLRQGSVMRMLLEGIESDHPRIIREILKGLTRDVIQDPGIPKRNKGFLFNERNLLSLCQVYRVGDLGDDGEDEDAKSLLDEFHEFMVTVCTSPDAGLLRPSGWYPPTDSSDPIADTLDLTSNPISTTFPKNLPLRNTTLSLFLPTLRTHASPHELSLLLAILTAAPELVALYTRKLAQTFPFTPKLTATWIGYAAALFSIVRLPVPELYARMKGVPPNVGIVVESVLPGAVEGKALRSALSSKVSLIRLFGVRIVVAALIKLRDVCALFTEQAKELGPGAASQLWDEAREKLVQEFRRRCPTLLDLTKLYGTLKNAEGGGQRMQREATLRALALFHEVLPQVALEEKWDVSIPLTSALQDLEGEDAAEQGQEGEEDEEGAKQLRLLELAHLVKIARWSSSVYWMGKTKGLKYSPLATLLRLLVRSKGADVQDIWDLVRGILGDGDSVQVRQSRSSEDASHSDGALEVLVYTLSRLETQDAVFAFLDNCFHRYAARPIKYEDDKDALLAKAGAGADELAKPCSLICMTLLEQWGFVKEHKQEIGSWICEFLQLLSLERDPIATAVQGAKVLEDVGLSEFDVDGDEELGEAFKMWRENHQTSLPVKDTAAADANIATTADTDMNDAPALDLTSLAPLSEPDNHPVLTRYRKKDLTTLIADNDLSSLILCLTSPHLSIRIQAISALRTIMSSLATSTHPDKDMLYLLLGELLETCTDNDVNSKPLTGIAAVFAAKAVAVMSDPTHALYPKVNEFLNRGPVWRVRALPAHWLDKVLLHPPGDTDADGAYWREVVWVLDWLFAGLLTNDDFDILRRNGVFEKLMALFFHPAMDLRGSGRLSEMVLDKGVLDREVGLQNKVRPLVLRLLGRAAMVGGATILVTGAGILGWFGDVIDVVKSDDRASAVVNAIEELVVQHADAEKIRIWSSGLLPK